LRRTFRRCERIFVSPLVTRVASMRVGNSWSEGWIGTASPSPVLILWREKVGRRDERWKIKVVREPSEEENSRDLEVRRCAPVFMSWLKP
jgi:hypothetical protein